MTTSSMTSGTIHCAEFDNKIVFIITDIVDGLIHFSHLTKDLAATNPDSCEPGNDYFLSHPVVTRIFEGEL